MRSKPHWLWTVLGVAALSMSGAGLAGCDGDAEDAAEEVGENLDKAGDNIEDAAKDAGNKIEDAVD